MRTIKRSEIQECINDTNVTIDDFFEVLNEDLYDEDEEGYDDDYTSLEFKFGDGHAITTDGKYYLDYPKVSELTDRDKEDIYRYHWDNYDMEITARDVAVIGDLYKVID